MVATMCMRGAGPAEKRAKADGRRLLARFFTQKTPHRRPISPSPLTLSMRICAGAATISVLPNDTCKLLACDFDDGTWKQDAAAVVSACTDHGIEALAEISRSGDGAHVWIFFDILISAMLARRLGFAMLRQAMNSRPDMDMSSYDRFSLRKTPSQRAQTEAPGWEI